MGTIQPFLPYAHRAVLLGRRTLWLGGILLGCWRVLPVTAGPHEIQEPPITAKDRQHWAFRALRRPALPAVRHGGQVRNPIDCFVLATLEVNQLTLAPAADPRTLIRRLTFDLTGLPPSVDEVERFVNDPSSKAYERCVDRLLASPAFGERWGQHWLDLARFAESDGFEHDQVRTHAWRYRDWVIGALNRDLPYDRFVQLQLAGDETAREDPSAILATGFLVAGPDMPDINLWKERRHNVLNEMTSTVGVVFLGLGVGCARCHDHKFDPVSQADFYRLRAFFANTTIPKRPHQLPPVIEEDGPNPPPSYLMVRGDFRRPGPEVAPGFLRIANPRHEVPPSVARKGAKTSGRRSALAAWLTEPDHPLTARVMVNRLWQHYFGRGIVGTPNDFGFRGEAPTHPKLLDWLATELVRRRWSLKAMHRLIVTSASYRQSSRGEGDGWRRRRAIDPDNRLFSRMNRRRLTGEAIRDAMLACSDSLNRKMGGRGVRPPLPAEVTRTLLRNQWRVSRSIEDHFRRSIYLFVRRNLRYPMFDVFDRPDANASCARRNVTTTAPQSLTLLNSEFSLDAARRLAGAILDEIAWPPAEWVERLYPRVLARPPSARERRLALSFLDRQAKTLHEEGREPGGLATPLSKRSARDPFWGAALTDLCLAIFNANEMIYLD